MTILEAPIVSDDQDEIGIHKFTTAISNAIASWTGEESLAVAIYGNWGSGKTSAWNLIEKKLAAGSRPPTILHFSPWMWSGEEALTTAFFDELAAALDSPSSAAHADSAKKLSLYATRLKFGRTALSALQPLAELSGIPGIAAALRLAATASKKSSETLDDAAAVHFADASARSLETLKSELRTSLSNLGTRIVVCLDDVDRLTSAEIRLLFRLIKCNGDFPNLVYVLLCDRDVVEKALDSESEGEGRKYLEKMIQIGFDLPVIPEGCLIHLLKDNLEQIEPVLPDADALTSMPNDAPLFSLFHTIRDVKRYLSVLSYSLPMLVHDGLLEVHVRDFAALEALRLFEPDVYRMLYRERLTILGTYHFYYLDAGRQHRQDRRKQTLDTLVSCCSETNTESCRRLLQELFPQFEANYCGSSEDMTEWRRALKVCHHGVFHRYFQFSLIDSEIPKSVIRCLLNAATIQEVQDIMQSLYENESLLEMPFLVEKQLDSTRSEVIEWLALTLNSYLDRGELRGVTHMLFPAHHWISEFVRGCVAAVDQDARDQLFLSLVESASSLFSAFCVLDYQSLEAKGVSKSVSTDSYEKAATMVVNRLKSARLEDLLVFGRTAHYLSRWEQWESSDAVTEWIERHITTPECAWEFLICMGAPEMNLRLLSNWISRDGLRTLCEQALLVGDVEDTRCGQIRNVVQHVLESLEVAEEREYRLGSSGVRHNSKCHLFKKARKACQADEGRACKRCGG